MSYLTAKYIVEPRYSHHGRHSVIFKLLMNIIFDDRFQSIMNSLSVRLVLKVKCLPGENVAF